MSEETKPEMKKREMVSAIFRTITIASFVCLIAAVLIFITVPLVSLSASEHNAMRNAPGETLVINEKSSSYALFSDGKAMVRVSNPFFWTFASQIRYNLKSPYYMRVSPGVECRVIYIRESLTDPFRRQCTIFDVSGRLHEIHQAFADGRQRFVDAAQHAKALYETYRTFGLVE